MAGVVFSRLMQFVVIAAALATLMFFMMRLTGDPARLILGIEAPDEAVEILREQLGLNRPISVQYAEFMYLVGPHFSEGEFGILDFGKSLNGPEAAMDLVMDRFPYTLALGSTAFFFAVILSVPLGTLAALRRGPSKALIMFVALIGQTVPNFVMAILMVFVFGVYLSVLPVFGFNGWQSIVLPAAALSAFPLARLTRLLRSQILETMPQDYVRTAYAKGLSHQAVVTKHVLRNAMLPWATMLGLDLGRLMAGSIIVETVFAYPGIGRQLITAISQRNYPVIQADIFIIGLVVVVGNLLADLSYRWLDPRIRVAA